MVIQFHGQSQSLAQQSVTYPGSEVHPTCSRLFLNEPVWPEEGGFIPQNTPAF